MKIRLPTARLSWGLAVWLTALLLRLAYLAEMRGSLRFQNLLVDAYYHDQWARSLAAGDWLGKEAFFRAPLYPYLVGAIYALLGPDRMAVRLWQALLGSLTAYLVYRLGCRLYGRVAGVVAGFMAATYWVFIYHEGEILIETLSVFLQTLLITVLVAAEERPRGWIFFLSGILLGLAAMARPNILLFGLVAALWFLFVWGRSHARRDLWRWLLLAAAGTVLIVSPVTVRNYVVSRDFVPISWQGGSTYFTGNNREADGFSARAPGVRTYWWEGYRDVVSIAEKSVGRTLSPGEVSRFWYDRAMAFAREEPGRFLRLQLRKLGLFWFAKEKGDDADINIQRRQSHVLTWLPLWFGLVAPLGLVGMILTWRGPPAGRLLFLYVVAWMVSVVLFFVTSRFRLPVVPPLMVWAGAAVAILVSWFTSGRWARAGLSLLALLVLVGLLNTDFYGASRDNWAQAHFNNGLMLTRAGRLEEAANEYREALRLFPGYLDALNNMGTVYLRLGRLEEAQDAFEKAARVDPTFALVHYNQGVVYERLNRPTAAQASYEIAHSLDPQHVETLFALAGLHQRAGHRDQAEAFYRAALQAMAETDRSSPASSREERAGLTSSVVRARLFLGDQEVNRNRVAEGIAEFRRALEADPLNPQAHEALGWALLIAGQAPEGEEELRAAIGLDPEGVEARYVLALHYASQGELRPAAAQLEEILRMQPTHRGALFNMGVVRARQHLLDDAMRYWERVLALDPNDKEASENLRKAREAQGR